MMEKNTNFVFLKKQKLTELYPQVKNIYVKTSFQNEISSEKVYINDDIGEYISCCTNSLCEDGGIRIGDVIQNMISKKETHFEGKKMCSGKERIYKNKFRNCLRFYNFVIDIDYHENVL